MKLGKIAMIAAAASSLAFAGVAGAADIELNIFGASAQYTFWNALAPSFLRTFGCTVTGAGQTADLKHGVTTATGCTVGGNTKTMLVRYSSKASYDGIHAVLGDANLTDSCGNSQRMMADEAMLSGTTVGATKCVAVSLGASDVAGESFTQNSTGQKLGPNSGGNVVHTFPASGISTSGLSHLNPIVVPFGFFANKAVKVQTCTAGTFANGQQCLANSDCGTGGVCGAPATITNLTRAQAVQIFSGLAAFWSDFGAGYVAQPIVTCLRHAGSGTHATLDYAVVRGNGWGNGVVQTEAPGGTPTVWFNDGSADEMNCVDGKIGGVEQANWYAVGYSDADQLTGSGATTYGNTVALTYNGVWPTRINVRNGVYDFFTNEWLFPNHANSSDLTTVISALNTFASDPANLTSANLGAKASYWATQAEMVWNKGTDQQYPIYIAPGTQTP